jgi:hypothetical protein
MFGSLVVVNGAGFLGYLFGGIDIRAPLRNNLFFINRKSDIALLG